MGVHKYVSRAEAEKDETGKFVKQELVYGERPDKLFARTPSLGSVRVALTHAMKKDTHKVMVMDVKCAFLYGEIHRSVYIELPHTDPRYGDGTLVEKLKKPCTEHAMRPRFGPRSFGQPCIVSDTKRVSSSPLSSRPSIWRIIERCPISTAS